MVSDSSCYTTLNSSDSVFNDLSRHDVFVFSRMLATGRLWPMRRWVGEMTVGYYFGRDFKVKGWCVVAGCDAETVKRTLINAYLKFVFLSWLPDLPETGEWKNSLDF